MSNNDPSAIVLHAIPCIGGLYIGFASNGDTGSLFDLQSLDLQSSDLQSLDLQSLDLQSRLAAIHP